MVRNASVERAACSLPTRHAGKGLRICDAVREDKAHGSATVEVMTRRVLCTRPSSDPYLHFAPRAADFNSADSEILACGCHGGMDRVRD